MEGQLVVRIFFLEKGRTFPKTILLEESFNWKINEQYDKKVEVFYLNSTKYSNIHM